MKIVIKKGGILWFKKYHLSFVAENGKILCRSRKMQSLDEIFYWLEKIKRSFVGRSGMKVEIVQKKDTDQPYYFHMQNIYSDDGEIILWSECYHNKKDCKDAVDLISKEIETSKVLLQ